MRALLIGTTFISVVVFPWVLTVLLVCVSALVEPLMPLAIGIFTDVLYYTPQVSLVPHYSFYGALLTVFAFFVRSRLRDGSM